MTVARPTAAQTPAPRAPSPSRSCPSTTPPPSTPERTRPCSKTPVFSRSPAGRPRSHRDRRTSPRKPSASPPVADIPGLFAVQPVIAADGTLTYTAAANANGVATITVTALDNGGTANGGSNSARKHLHDLDHRPSTTPRAFTAGANQTDREDDGAQSAAGAATAITPGPANESSQSVSFTVTSDNPALFTVQPAIATDGTLTYTPAPTPTASPLSPSPPSTMAAPPTAARTPASPHPHHHRRPRQRRPHLQRGIRSVGCLAPRRTDRPRLGDGHHGRAGGRVLPERHLHPSRAPTRGLFAVQPAIAPDGTLTLHADPARARNRDRHRARE